MKDFPLIKSHPAHTIWTESKFFILLMTPLWIASLALLIHLGYQGSFLALNQHYLPALDSFMLQVTHFGDGAFLIPIIAMVLIWKKPEAILVLLIAAIIAGITTYILKTYIFQSWDRPLLVINPPEMVHTVKPYLLYKYTFPSGHSLCIATIATTLSLCFYRSRTFIVLATAFMILVSYSRIYLGVHFLGDVLVGNWIGVTIAFLVTTNLLAPIRQWTSNLKKTQIIALRTVILLLSIATLAINCYFW